MKTKLFTLLVALITTTSIWAYDFQSGNLYYNITSETTVEVTYLEQYSSANYSGLTIATIPETVTYNGTTYSVTSIEDYAFYYCTSLTSVTIPNSVTSIGTMAFSNCNSLTSIVVEKDNTTYDSHDNCNAIIETATNTLIAGCQNTIIPNSVTSIGDRAFYGCSSLTSVTIPNSVTSIEELTFYQCRSLTSITIPNSVTSIGSDAFQDCSSLTSVTIGNSVTSIGGEAFCNCTSLTSITIPNSVTSIEELTFYQCFSLTSVTIGNSVTSIEESAFVGCFSLTSMVVESGNSTYDSRENCNAIIETATNTLIAGCQNTIIPNSVTNVGSYAFYYCSSLTSITIPSSVTSIEGESVFAGCIFVKENFINNSSLDAQANNYWGATIVDSETDGLIIRNDTVIRCRPNVISANIPTNVTAIGDLAFYGCSSLTSITIPNSVTSIGDFAFYYCTSLSSVTCLAMTPSAMGVWVFDECDNPTLFVLCNALSDYQAHEQWGQFANIECIGAEAVETEEVVIESGTTTISITWPTEESANTYTIVVKKADEVVCTLIFNAEGQLITAAFAPGRNGNRPAQYAEQASNGYRFTVTGLTEATQYAYNITTKDAANNTIATYSGEFTTMGGSTSAVEDILQNTTNVQKLLRNGQLIIVRDGVEYNAVGQEL